MDGKREGSRILVWMWWERSLVRLEDGKSLANGRFQSIGFFDDATVIWKGFCNMIERGQGKIFSHAQRKHVCGCVSIDWR